MLTIIYFAVCIVVYAVQGKSISAENEMSLSCNFNTYDVDGNGEISEEEFVKSTGNLARINPNELFEQLDIDGDGKIMVNDLSNMDSSLLKTGIFDHCKRFRCNCSFCICG